VQQRGGAIPTFATAILPPPAAPCGRRGEPSCGGCLRDAQRAEREHQRCVDYDPREGSRRSIRTSARM